MSSKVAGGNSRKKGRNLKDCQRYRAEMHREKNKARKLARHIKRVPWDATARTAFAKLPELARRGFNDLPPIAEKPAVGIWRRKPSLSVEVAAA